MSSPIACIVELARAVRDNFMHEAAKHGGLHETDAYQLAKAVLDLLVQDGPCGWDKADIVNVDSDGYVSVFAVRDLPADEAHWAALVILDAALAAKEQGK